MPSASAPGRRIPRGQGARRRAGGTLSLHRLDGCLTAAALGLGAALALENVVQPFLRDRSLACPARTDLQARRAYYVVHSSHRHLREPAQRFVDWLLALRAAGG